MIRQEKSSRGNDDACPKYPMENLQLAPHPSRISLRSTLATLSPYLRGEGRARRSRAKGEGHCCVYRQTKMAGASHDGCAWRTNKNPGAMAGVFD
jgi:hypothetical protein